MLDTNVVSELIRRTPDVRVLRWLDAFEWDDCLITAITAAELRAGVAAMPSGRRRSELGAEIEHLLQTGFGQRILPFDDAATFHFADLRSSRQQRGRPVGFADAQIAAIARSRNYSIATRDTEGFADCGVPVTNPWLGLT